MSKVLEDVVLKRRQKLKLSSKERAKKLERNKRQEARLHRKLDVLQLKRSRISTEIEECNKLLNRLADELGRLDSYQSALVSEGALISYLKTYKDLDIDATLDEILALPESNIDQKGAKIIKVTKQVGF